MIPFAILSGIIKYENGRSLEIRVLDLGMDSFTFRTAKEDRPTTENPIREIHLNFWDQGEGRYETCQIEEPKVARIEETLYYDCYRVETNEAEFGRLAAKLSKQYMRYVELKLAGDEVSLSHEMAGYPANREASFPGDFQQWRKQRLNQEPDELWKVQVKKVKEIGICLDNENAWGKFAQGLVGEELTGTIPHTGTIPQILSRATHAYIGNQFCALLFPDEQQLAKILQRCAEQGIKSVLCLAPTSQSRLEITRNRVDHCVKNGIREIVVNDWGMARWIHQTYGDQVSITMGILLHKMSKDPRQKYRKEQPKMTALAAPFYQEWIKKQGNSRISLEACGYQYEIPKMDVDFYLPFYQTNTSGHCITYAMCKNGRRGDQESVKSCPGYCKDQYVLYPDHLNLVGCYNSLFGFDETIMQDGEYLKCMIEQGVKRLILQIL